MVKKINNYIYLSIIISAILLILSGMCIFKPDLSFEIVTCLLIGIFIVTGICLLVEDYRHRSLFMSNFFYGVFSIIIGLVLWLNPNVTRVILPIGIGIWFIMSALLNVRFAVYFKSESTGYLILSIMCNLIAIICGAVLIIKPLETSSILMSTLGITFAFYSLSNLIDVLIIKKYVDKIHKNIQKYVSKYID